VPRTEEANQEIREQRRSHILHIAAKVFANRGYGDTKIADIAESAEMSQGLIYRYFSSKEEVFGILVGFVVEITIGLLKQVKAMEDTGYQKIEWLTAQLLPNYYQRPEFTILIVHALANKAVPTKVRESVDAHMERIQSSLYELVLQGQTDGSITKKDPERLIMFYLASLQGLALGVYHLNFPPEKYPTVDDLMLIFKEKNNG
jgi:AcrR family transcriptional regulator